MKNLVVIVLVINALFWGLASHDQHCSVADWVGLGGDNCPPHYVHLMMGLAFFVAAVYCQQKSYFDKLV